MLFNVSGLTLVVFNYEKGGKVVTDKLSVVLSNNAAEIKR